MAKTQSWEVSDELWQKVQPWVPKPLPRLACKHYQRSLGAGRKPLGDRQIFAGIVYLLRTGCQWKALLKCQCDSQTLSMLAQTGLLSGDLAGGVGGV